MSEILSTGENDGVRISNQLMCTQSYSLMHTQSQSIHNMSQLYPTFSHYESRQETTAFKVDDKENESSLMNAANVP